MLEAFITGIVLYLVIRTKKHTTGSARDSANKAAAYLALISPIAAFATYNSFPLGTEKSEYYYLLFTNLLTLPLMGYILVRIWKAVFGLKNQAVFDSSAKKEADSSLAINGSLDISEAGRFLQAKNEIENDTKDEGIWAIAYSNTTNKKEAKKLYIKLRVDKIYEDSELSSLDSVKKKSLFGIWGGLLVLIILFIMVASFIGL
jgi:hypothetical protein